MFALYGISLLLLKMMILFSFNFFCKFAEFLLIVLVFPTMLNWWSKVCIKQLVSCWNLKLCLGEGIKLRLELN